MPGAKKCFSLFSIPFVLAILFAILLIWLFHLTCLFKIMPRKLKSVIGSKSVIRDAEQLSRTFHLERLDSLNVSTPLNVSKKSTLNVLKVGPLNVSNVLTLNVSN